MSLLLLFQGQGQAPTLVDVSQLIQGLVPVFNSDSLENLSIISEAELYEFANEAADRLARRVGLFVKRDATLTITGGVATLSVPSDHLSSIHASYDADGEGAWVPLRVSAVNELEALDEQWEAAEGTPTRWTSDQQSHDTLRVYEVPASNTGFALIYHHLHAALSSGSPTFNVPTPVGDYLKYSMIGEVRGQENDEAMPEVSEYARGRAEAYLELFEQYWGRAQ